MDNKNPKDGEESSTKEHVSTVITELGTEFHRISWPKGKELYETTGVVLAFVIGLAAIVFCFDKIIEYTLKCCLGA